MNLQKDVLITDYVHSFLFEGLHSQGYSWTYAPEMSKAEMEMILPLYKGVVINTRCGIDKSTIEKCPDLRWIARLGSGMEIIDVEAAHAKGIHLISAPEGNAQAVAEHALGMLLCLSNRLIPADHSVRNGQWLREENRGWEISGKTIGIIGYGNNGSAFGRLWHGWNVRVLAYDKYLESYGSEKVIPVDLASLLEQADIISFHIPLTPETLEMVNHDFISKCKKRCVIINTSRGKIVDLDALLDGLQSEHIKGACLDVMPIEPPSSGPNDYQMKLEVLYSMDNVVLSPHVAGWSVESKRRIAEIIVGKLKRHVIFPPLKGT